MSYTAPTISSTGPEAAATTTRFADIREYVTNGIVAGDLAADKIDTGDLARGEYLGVATRHQFLTGDMHGKSNDGEPIHRDYFTCQVKGVDPQSQTLWHVVPEAGDVVVLENGGHIVYQCALEVVCENNYQVDYDTNGTVNNDGLSTLFKLRVNDTLQDDTNSHHGEEGLGLPIAATPSDGNFGSASNKRRICYITWVSGTLAAGEHKLEVVCNAVVDRGFVGARSVAIECIEF